MGRFGSVGWSVSVVFEGDEDDHLSYFQLQLGFELADYAHREEATAARFAELGAADVAEPPAFVWNPTAPAEAPAAGKRPSPTRQRKPAAQVQSGRSHRSAAQKAPSAAEHTYQEAGDYEEELAENGTDALNHSEAAWHASAHAQHCAQLAASLQRPAANGVIPVQATAAAAAPFAASATLGALGGLPQAGAAPSAQPTLAALAGNQAYGAFPDQVTSAMAAALAGHLQAQT